MGASTARYRHRMGLICKTVNLHTLVSALEAVHVKHTHIEPSKEERNHRRVWKHLVTYEQHTTGDTNHEMITRLHH